VVSPTVEVKLVSQSNSVFLAGSASGTVALKPGDRLATALTDAKIAPTGDLTRVGIIRNGVVSAPYDVRALRAAKDPGPPLVSGDVINIPSKPVVVAVSGAVKAPGVAYLDAGEPLSDAFVQVPVSDDADLAYVQLRRQGMTCTTALGQAVLAAAGQSEDELVVGRPAHVTVGGSVGKPGTVTLKGDRSLVNAVALAGGPSKEGNLHAILVMRAGSSDKGTSYDVTQLSQGLPASNPDLAEGDSVYVTQAKTRVDPRVIFAAVVAAAKKLAKLAL
jgi:protein involved in polysaccharide export with SLBB domain